MIELALSSKIMFKQVHLSVLKLIERRMMKRLGEIINVFKGDQGRMNFFLVIVWASYPLSLLFNFFFSKIPIIKEDKEIVFPVFLIICLLFAFRGFFKDNFIRILVFYLVTFFIIAFCDIYAPPLNIRFIEEYLPAFFFLVLPFVFIGNEYRDERIFYPLYLVSVLAIFVIFVYHFILNPLSEIVFDDDQESYQGLAYTLLPFMLIVLWRLCDKFDFFKLLIVIFSFFLLLLLGSRGSILSAFLFVVLYLVIIKKMYKKIGWILLLAMGGVLIYAFFEQILLYFLDIAGELGYSTRILEMLVEGDVTYENGRDVIVTQILNALRMRPLGLGLCGSQVVASGFYAHNLFLEFLATFGWYFGGFLCVLLIILIIKGFSSCVDEKQRGFYLVLFCISFLPSLISGIFLRDPLLFMFLGYNFYLIDNKTRLRKVVLYSKRNV